MRARTAQLDPSAATVSRRELKLINARQEYEALQTLAAEDEAEANRLRGFLDMVRAPFFRTITLQQIEWLEDDLRIWSGWASDGRQNVNAAKSKLDKAEVYAAEGRRKAQERQEKAIKEEATDAAEEKTAGDERPAEAAQDQYSAQEIQQLSAQAAYLTNQAAQLAAQAAQLLAQAARLAAAKGSKSE